jgi:hypothetical protein
MRAGARGIHMGDMEQFGNPIVGTFENPGIVGSRQYVCLASDLVSWDDVVAIPREEGHDIAYAQTDEDPYWLHDMFAYFGPDADQEIELAKTISTEPTSDFRTWSTENMPVGDWPHRIRLSERRRDPWKSVSTALPLDRQVTEQLGLRAAETRWLNCWNVLSSQIT